MLNRIYFRNLYDQRELDGHLNVEHKQARNTGKLATSEVTTRNERPRAVTITILCHCYLDGT